MYKFDEQNYKHYLVKRMNSCFGSTLKLDIWVEGAFYNLDIVKQNREVGIIKLESKLIFCKLFENIDETKEYYDFDSLELSIVQHDDLDY